MSFRNRITRMSQLVADVVTGGLIRTDIPNNRRIEIGKNDNPDNLPDYTVRFYSGDAAEQKPAYLRPYPGSGPLPGGLILTGSDYGSHAPAAVSVTDAALIFEAGANAFAYIVFLQAEEVRMQRPLRISRTGIGGRLLRDVDFGTSSLVTNASGEDTVPHQLNADPDAVIVTGALAGTQVNKLRVTAHNSSNFTVELRNSATNAIPAAGTAFTVFWIAFAG